MTYERRGPYVSCLLPYSPNITEPADGILQIKIDFINCIPLYCFVSSGMKISVKGNCLSFQYITL